MARSFRGHVSNYAWAEGAAAVAGLLSFPILTRLLSVADYGTMNLVATALGLTVALGKLGVQHAALRHWSELPGDADAPARLAYESTVVWGMFGSGVVVAVAWALLVAWLPAGWWAEPGAGAVMLFVTPLIAIRVLDSALINQLRAQEASGAMALYSTARRYAVLVTIVAILWWLRRDLWGLYGATIAVELLMVVGLMAWMFRGRRWPVPSRVSLPLYGSFALFGLPMLGSELSTLVLTMGDRFIIQTQLGAEPLGVYAASYNLCDQLRGFLLGALVGAAYPRCLQLWSAEGEPGVRRFLEGFLHHYVLVALYLVALLTAVGGNLLAVLASSRYAAGAELTGWLMAALAVQTVSQVAGVGLYLAKRTTLVMLSVLGAGILSLAANSLLVPVLGARAAAWTAFGASCLLAVVQMLLARRIAPVVVPWRALATGGLAAALAAGLASRVHAGMASLDLVLRGLAVTGLYAALVLGLDARARRLVRDTLRDRLRAG